MDENTLQAACTNCGNCCTSRVRMTQGEIEEIKQYIIDNDIQESIYRKDGRLENVCPFRDVANQRCNIYEVRPEVCQRFECWTSGLGLEGHVERILETSSPNCNTHEVFYDNYGFKAEYDEQNPIVEDSPPKPPPIEYPEIEEE